MRALPFARYAANRFPRHLAASAGLLAASNLFDAAAVFSVAPIVDYLMSPDLEHMSRFTRRALELLKAAGLPVSLSTLLAVFLGLFVLMNAFQIAARYWTLKMKYAVLRDLYVGTFEDFFRARWFFFSSGSQGTMLNTFLREISNVGNAFGSLTQLMASAIQLGLYASVPFLISWRVTAACLAVAALAALPFILAGKLSYALGQVNTETSNRIGTVIQENLALAKIVLGFGRPEKGAQALAVAFDRHVEATIKFQTWGNSIGNVYQPLGLLVVCAALLYSRRLGLPLSEAAVLLLALVRIIPAIGQLATQKAGLDNLLPSYDQVNTLREHARSLKQVSGSEPFRELKTGLTIEGLTFGYPGREPVLSGVSLKVPKGRMIAFVGESGSGKSTMVDLLMGLHEPLGGRILCDGRPLLEFDIDSYRRRIGYVPQDSVLFNASIRENLLWAKPDATDNEIRRALRQAHAENFVFAAPEGLEAEIGDRGVRLSGGQVQRLALARAILRKPDILFLDEATSALDSQSEREIQSAIDELSRETTLVVVAHRLSTIAKADRVYVFAKGRIVQEGGYAELSEKEGPFRAMARLQALRASDTGDTVQ